MRASAVAAALCAWLLLGAEPLWSQGRTRSLFLEMGSGREPSGRLRISSALAVGVQVRGALLLELRALVELPPVCTTGEDADCRGDSKTVELGPVATILDLERIRVWAGASGGVYLSRYPFDSTRAYLAPALSGGVDWRLGQISAIRVIVRYQHLLRRPPEARDIGAGLQVAVGVGSIEVG